MSAVYYQGENVILSCRIVEPKWGDVPLTDFDISWEIRDRYGKEIEYNSEADEIKVIVDGDMIYLLLHGNVTAKMEGLYYAKVTLKYGEQIIKTNELNKLEIIR